MVHRIPGLIQFDETDGHHHPLILSLLGKLYSVTGNHHPHSLGFISPFHSVNTVIPQLSSLSFLLQASLPLIPWMYLTVTTTNGDVHPSSTSWSLRCHIHVRVDRFPSAGSMPLPAHHTCFSVAAPSTFLRRFSSRQSRSKHDEL